MIVPAQPGLFSAFGLLDADLHVNDVRPILRATGDADDATLARFFDESESSARGELLAQGAHAATIAFRRQYDARYRGQSFELTIEHDPDPAEVAQRFHRAHRARYGYDVPDETVELVNARLMASGKIASFDSTAPLGGRPLRMTLGVRSATFGSTVRLSKSTCISATR